MPEIQTKDKLITLEELGVALDGKASVTGVKGNAESSYRQGNVNITPANIGALPNNIVKNILTISDWLYFPYTNGFGNDRILLIDDSKITLADSGWNPIWLMPTVPVSVGNGGTGATTAAGARNNLGIHTFHGNVNINSNGQGFISFSDFGLSSRPNVCFMEVINVANTTVRYNYGASTSQIVLEPFWTNATPITSTTVEMQGIAFA